MAFVREGSTRTNYTNPQYLNTLRRVGQDRLRTRRNGPIDGDLRKEGEAAGAPLEGQRGRKGAVAAAPSPDSFGRPKGGLPQPHTPLVDLACPFELGMDQGVHDLLEIRLDLGDQPDQAVGGGRGTDGAFVELGGRLPEEAGQVLERVDHHPPLKEMPGIRRTDPTGQRPVPAGQEQLTDQQREDLAAFLVQGGQTAGTDMALEDLLDLVQEGDKDHLHALDQLRQAVLGRVDEILQQDPVGFLGDHRDPEKAAGRGMELLDPLGGESDLGPDLDRIVADPIGADDQTLEDPGGLEAVDLDQVGLGGAPGSRRRRRFEIESPVVILVEDDEIARVEVHGLGPRLGQSDGARRVARLQDATLSTGGGPSHSRMLRTYYEARRSSERPFLRLSPTRGPATFRTEGSRPGGRAAPPAARGSRAVRAASPRPAAVGQPRRRARPQ